MSLDAMSLNALRGTHAWPSTSESSLAPPKGRRSATAPC